MKEAAAVQRATVGVGPDWTSVVIAEGLSAAQATELAVEYALGTEAAG